MIIGADVGGTFTDLVGVDNGVVTSSKIPTSDPQSLAVTEGSKSLALASGIEALIHGTTVATNALLERRGARTALVTDAGFEDVIEIARQDRPSLYDPNADRSPALVARGDRIGVDGDALDGVPSVEAVAIALIDGHVEVERERALAQQVTRHAPDVAVSLSSVVAPEFREFERVSTTVLNAYLTPVTASYLRRLDQDLLAPGIAESVSVMRSSGGLMSLDAAAALPAAVLLSGPAGGVIAAQRLGSLLGLEDVVSFDMGGTSTDVCLIEGGLIDVSYERSIDGYACRMPSVGIHTVGAGGGSIAWIDAGGSLRVGPQSAGARPGPACYGKGGSQPTVTDAHVVLGRIGSQATLGGSLHVDLGLATDAVATVARPLGIGVTEAAVGIIRIAEATMAGAVRTVSIDAGADPSAAHLVAFGGAGGLHASAVARSLGMAGVIIPPLAGVFSAVGLLLAPPRTDAVAAVHIIGHDLGAAWAAADQLVLQTADGVGAAGSTVASVDIQLDVRYIGQAHEVSVPWTDRADHPEVVSRFEALHQKRYGFSRPGDPIEIMAVRCSSLGVAPLAHMPRTEAEEGRPGAGERDVVVSDGSTRSTAVIDRSQLGSGMVVIGPAIIEEHQSTTFLDRGERADVASDGSLVISW